MSAASVVDAIRRAGAAALDEKDEPYKLNETYATDEEREKFLTLLVRNVTQALKLLDHADRNARAAERAAKRASTRSAKTSRQAPKRPPVLRALKGAATEEAIAAVEGAGEEK